MEKYISFTIGCRQKNSEISLQFIDSIQFIPSSLEKLANNLDDNQFNILKVSIPQHIELLLRKGVYPYEYISSFEKFDEVILPPIETFYSSLTLDHISQDDYEHALKVWENFQMKNLGKYHDLYVKTDVLILADVFQNFRKICKDYYDLDCAHMFTSPGLAWQACLKMTVEPLELFTDMNMHLLIEKGIRGGIAMITQRWARVNHKYLKDYDTTKPSTYILYLDANNLYGHAMSQSLPYGGFQWISPEDKDEEWILNIPDSGSIGYIFEVDLTYPQELHELHNDYPLAPERYEITRDMWSPYNVQLCQHRDNVKCTKLVPNLHDKKKYVTHFRNLKLYLRLGLKLQKIHNILQFNQKPWLQGYINFNTEKRKQANSLFEKDFFKLMNNAVYGKTMENVRNRSDIKLVNDERKAQKLVAAPSFHAYKEFSNNLVGVERMKKSVTLNKPIYVGFAILELSKLHMYDFHYNFMKMYYGEKAELLFTDTDSLCYKITTNDVYHDMAQNLHLFDTSDFPTTHPLYNTTNNKKIGCFKDELGSIPILEFIGLRPKMYSILTMNEEKKTAKGVAKSVIKKKLKHQHYKECLLSRSVKRENQNSIRSDHHNLYTVNINKISLSSFDDKRYILEDGVHSLSYGHYQI